MRLVNLEYIIGPDLAGVGCCLLAFRTLEEIPLCYRTRFRHFNAVTFPYKYLAPFPGFRLQEPPLLFLFWIVAARSALSCLSNVSLAQDHAEFPVHSELHYVQQRV